jgi:hypothetical protein
MAEFPVDTFTKRQETRITPDKFLYRNIAKNMFDNKNNLQQKIVNTLSWNRIGSAGKCEINFVVK